MKKLSRKEYKRKLEDILTRLEDAGEMIKSFPNSDNRELDDSLNEANHFVGQAEDRIEKQIRKQGYKNKF